MLTDRCFVEEGPHPGKAGGDILDDTGRLVLRADDWGVQRIYRCGDWGLSLINGTVLHSYKFAWEAAVLQFKDDKHSLVYDTPLTSDVEVFPTDEETNEFINKALDYFESFPIEKVKKAMRKVQKEDRNHE